MSDWLDDHRELLGPVSVDLRRHGVKPTGRKGLPAETVLRCALLKQHRQLSYEELAFYVGDSASLRAFARLPVPLDAEEVGVAEDDLCDRGRYLGTDQSLPDTTGEDGQGGERRDDAGRQHGHRCADPSAE